MAVCSSVPYIHILAVVLGSMEIILFGGVIFGWHSVVYVYKDMDYFSSLCPLGSDNAQVINITSLSMLNATIANVSNDYGVSGSSSFNGMVGTTASAMIDAALEVTDKNRTQRKQVADLADLSCAQHLELQAQGRASGVCKAQDEQFNLIFSLATGINGMMCFPSGFMYDRLGTRISRIFSIVSFVVGQLCLIFASPSNPYLLYPGFVGLVYGGYQILLTNLQLSCLIPSLRSTIMSLYSGSYDTSASIFLIFKAAHEGGISINLSFGVQAVLYVLIIFSSTFLFLPRDRVPFPLKPGYRLRCYLCQKLCGPPNTLQAKAWTRSNEWRIDPSGSVILCRVPSRDLLEEGLKSSADEDAATDKFLGSSGGANGDAPTEEFAHSGGGSGTGDSSSQEEEEKELNLVTGDCDKGEPQSRDIGPSAVDGEVKHSMSDMEVEDLPLNNSGENKQQSPGSQDSNATVSSGEKGAGHTATGEDNLLYAGPAASREEPKTFLQVALSPLFLTDVMWISVQRLRSWIFVGMFNPWITRLACGDKALVSHYTSVYAAMQFFGILTAPLSGCLMDRHIKGAERYGNPRYERLHAAIASFVLNSTVSVLLTVCTLIPVLELQYLTFVLHCLHRSFLYGPNSAFVANAFPNEHFGKLFGVTLTVSALFSMLQYPMFLIMQGPLKGDPLAINVFLLMLMLISYIHPIYIWRYLQKKLAKASA